MQRPDGAPIAVATLSDERPRSCHLSLTRPRSVSGDASLTAESMMPRVMMVVVVVMMVVMARVARPDANDDTAVMMVMVVMMARKSRNRRHDHHDKQQRQQLFHARNYSHEPSRQICR